MVTSSSPDLSQPVESEVFRTNSDLPTLDGCERRGDALSEGGEHSKAIAEFKRALLLLGAERGKRRAALYVKLADAHAALNNPRVAINNYIKALAIEPLDDRPYRRALELLNAERDFAGADELNRRRVQALDADGDKLEVWRENSRMWLDTAQDPKRAIRALTELLAICPGDVDARYRLAESQEAVGDIECAIETRRMLAELLDAPQAAAVLKRAAELARDELKDAERAVGLCVQVLLADPEREDILQMAEELLVPAQAYSRLGSIYELVLDGSRIVERQVRVARKLGALYRKQLRDASGAARIYARAVDLCPSDGALHRTLGELCFERGDLDAALGACRNALARAPRDAEAYHLAYAISDKSGLSDTAFCAASVLDFLGEADINESLVADAHRPEGLLGAQGTLSDEHWRKRLLFPERSQKLDALLTELHPAAVQAELQSLQTRREQPQLEEAERQDLESSTATMMRALLWTARLLGIDPPAVYVSASRAGDIEPLATSEPSLRVARTLGSGVSLKQLAFLWGRSLCVFRPEYYLAVFYPTPERLGMLLTAALANPERAPSVTALRQTLDRHVDVKKLARLSKALRGTKNRRAAARRWLASYELASTRAGLLACGDIAEAAELVRRFAFGNVTTADEQLDDLLAFSVSAQYAELRQAIGVAVS